MTTTPTTGPSGDPGSGSGSGSVRLYAAETGAISTHDHIIDYTSAATHAPWWERHDPFWEDELFTGSPHWRYKATYTDLYKPTYNGQLRKLQIEVPDFKPLTRKRATSPRTRQIIALLGQYHHLTSNQLAALGGWHPNQTRHIVSPLWTAGLLERHRFAPRRILNQRADMVWQLRHDQPLTDWLNTLPHPDWARVTLGTRTQNPGAGRRHLRHNLLTSELMVRAHETLPTISVCAGEPLSTPHLLLPPGHPHTPTRPLPFRADLTMFRYDGLRIVIETTLGTAEDAVAKKMRRWGRLLANYTTKTSGLIVVFVNADIHKHENTARSLRRVHTNTLTPEGLGDPNHPAPDHQVRNARNQILIASWREWFPNTWTISTRFTNLTATFNTNGTWQHTNIADPTQTPFEPDDRGLWLQAPINLHQSTHHPTWAGRHPTTKTA